MIVLRLSSLFLCLSALGGTGATTVLAQAQISVAQLRPSRIPTPPVQHPPPYQSPVPGLGGSLPPITSPGGNNPGINPPSSSTDTVANGCPPNCPDRSWVSRFDLPVSIPVIGLEDRRRQLIDLGNAVHADLVAAPQQDYWQAYQLIATQHARLQELLRLVVLDIYVPMPAAADAAMREVVVAEAAKGLRDLTLQVADIIAAKMQQNIQQSLGELRWESERERAQKMDVIRRSEAEVNAYHRAARDELGMPERFQRVYEAEPTRGGVYYRSGTAIRQLDTINTRRIWKNQ